MTTERKRLADAVLAADASVAAQILACLDGRDDPLERLPDLASQLLREAATELSGRVRRVIEWHGDEVHTALLWCLFALANADQASVTEAQR